MRTILSDGGSPSRFAPRAFEGKRLHSADVCVAGTRVVRGVLGNRERNLPLPEKRKTEPVAVLRFISKMNPQGERR